MEQRASSTPSAGIEEYSTSYRVEEDILSRIRALVLSRSKTRPPRTPHPSDERNPPQHETRVLGSFDFATIKSPRGSIQTKSQSMEHFDQFQHFESLDGGMGIDGPNSRRPTEPNVIIQKSSRGLRSSSSANDIGVTINITNDAAMDSEPLNATPSPAEKKRFRLPRLVLRDVKEPELPSGTRITVQSCLKRAPGYKKVPVADPSVQDDDQTCPHCEQISNQGQATSDMSNNNAEFSQFDKLPQSPPQEAKHEIACSPHCPPNCGEHYVYHPLPPLALEQQGKPKSDVKTVKEQINSIDYALKERIERPKTTSPQIQRKPTVIQGPPVRPKSETSYRTTTLPDTDASLPSSRGTSVSSVDVFPHALTSEMVAKELIPLPLSSGVVTNFSLPGPKAHISLPAEEDLRSTPTDKLRQSSSKKDRSPSNGSVRTKHSDSSLKSKKNTPSLLSGASRTSARHSLLKPSILASQPVETGLPVSPLLSPVVTTAESSAGRAPSPARTTKIPLEPILAEIAAAAELSAFDPTDDEGDGNQPDEETRRPRKNDKFVVEEISPTSIKLGFIDKAQPSLPILTAVVTVPDRLKKRVMDKPEPKPSIPERHEAHTIEGMIRRRSDKIKSEHKSIEEIERQKFPPGSTQSPRGEEFPLVDPLNAVYWGFVPAVKEAVQDAVQVAVQNAVKGIAVPPGIERDEASDAYRMLVANSLAEAAKTADNYLRRASLWNNPPDSVRDSYNEPDSRDNKEPQIVENDDLNPAVTRLDSVPEKSETIDIVANPETMEEVPLDPTQGPVGENQKQASSTQAPFIDAIPARGSSKNHSPYRTITSSNASVVFSLKERNSRRGSKDGVMAGSENPSQQRHAQDAGNASDDRISRKNTVHWLRDLLTNNDSYAPRLTALPPRSRRAETRSGSSGRARSQTVPPIPVNELFLGATPSPLESKPKLGELGSTEDRAAIAETFARTINDLEKLLNEALFIARQAADKDDRNYVPTLLGNAAAILKGGRKNMGKERYSAPPKSQAKKRKERKPSVESIHSAHESARSYSGTSTEGNSDSGIEDEDPIPLENVLPFGKKEKPNKINTTAADCVVSFAKGRDRSTTWDSARALHAMGLPAYSTTLERQKTLRRPSMPAVGFRNSQTSPFSEAAPIDVDASTSKPEPPSTVATSTFNWQDISESHTALQSPTVQRSMKSLNNREQPKGQPLYEEDESTLAKLPITELRTKTSVSDSLDGSYPSETVDFQTGFHHEYIMQHIEGKNPANRSRAQTGGPSKSRRVTELRDEGRQENLVTNRGGSMTRNMNMSHHLFNLDGKRHVSLRDHKGFSLARTHKRRPIARDWSSSRKRFVATVSCLSTALVGMVIGIYAGEVPAIQYLIVDLHHYTVLGNVFFFLGLAIPTTFFWPLPLLHGRKPYILGSMSIAMPLLFPQALAVGMTRNPNLPGWRIGLILSRSLMGFALGFANMNFLATLMDLFGASLQSTNPHQEYVDESDVRRHGGGMGIWLGIWTWCYIGSIGIGFMIGAIIINNLSPAWGFYVSIAILAMVLVINVVAPEVRRSAFRRSVAEVRNETTVSRRLAKGEVKMHRVQTGPKWWGEEFHHGMMLSHSMIRQPGFLVLAFYVAWVYAQIILIIILLGSLTSKYYKFRSPYVGASVASVPLGALLSVPFQKAGIFSRERRQGMQSDDDTLKRKKVSLSSHFVRRSIFVLVLPFMGLAYTLSSQGPPTPFILPIIWAAAIGFLSNLAVAECNGIIMETFDTSDLQPGMTGRPRSGIKGKVTNYSCFPRVCSAFAVTQGMGFCLAALASGIGGVAQRHLGQQAATGVMCGILLILSILLISVLLRFQDVQIIPESKTGEMEQWHNAKRNQYINGNNGEVDDEWRPVIIGNPTHIMRRMSVLELGAMTRWSEIRKKNKLIDETSLEARHPNLNTLGQVELKLKEKRKRAVDRVRRSLSGSRDGSYDSKGEGEGNGGYEGIYGGGFRGEEGGRDKGADEDEEGDREGVSKLEMGKAPERERRRSGKSKVEGDGDYDGGRDDRRSGNRSRGGGQNMAVDVTGGDLGGHREMSIGGVRSGSRDASRVSTGRRNRMSAMEDRGSSRLRRGTVISRGIEEGND
ncbi:Major facilitator superfamily transporter protein [Rutstroemia sp. NJR-2017a BVV2]|nr:Major facilitator superfamily transporter protein [Rutstroemia sp. NJR-2017a BVV2]